MFTHGTSVLAKICESLPSLRTTKPEKILGYEILLEPLQFHQKCSPNVRLNSDRLIASRLQGKYREAYVFTDHPVEMEEFVAIEILQTDRMFAGGLNFGLTHTDPSEINTDRLLERACNNRDYFQVTFENIERTQNENDIFIFWITRNGQLYMRKNDGNNQVLLQKVKNTSSSIWWFFDLYGSTQKIRAFHGSSDSKSSAYGPKNVPILYADFYDNGDLQVEKVVFQNQGDNNNHNLHAESAISEALDENLSENLNTSNGENSTTGNSEKECGVCCDRPINALLLPCSHLGFCYDCARRLFLGDGGGCCPICRCEIKSVTKVYNC